MNKKPNIILINVDDMGYSDVGCYGSKLNKTPCIDKMAKDGMMFTDFYAGASVCSPSRAGMLTGCYPKRIGCQQFKFYNRKVDEENPIDTCVVLLPGQPEGLNPSETTLADIAKKGGYSTKLVGKWHLGDQEEFSPLNYGFDEFLGLPYSNDLGIMTPDKPKHIENKIDYYPLPLMNGKEVIAEQPDIASITELYTNTATQYIRDNKDNPFFLYFSHTYVHVPLFVNQHFMKYSENGALGAAMAAIDWSLAEILYELKRCNIEENTIVMFVSDNGGGKKGNNCNYPLKGFKGNIYEGGHRVNCIMKWPEKIKANTVCKEVTSMYDFFPTFEELVGVKMEDNLKRDGYSMLPFFENPETAKTKYEAFYYYRENRLEAVRVGDYKYLIRLNELYNLANDIGEENNIIENHPEVVTLLKEYAQKAREDMGDELTNIVGKNCREIGFVKDYKPLTTFDANKPYLIPMYDLDGAIN
ncbi:MAG: sulfatase [Clostridia bacterium]